CLQHNSCPPTF
nr:immunoglobulin light chain junction region [Macaca mulatta]